MKRLLTKEEEAALPDVYAGVPLPTLTEEEVDKMGEADKDGRLYKFRVAPPDDKYRSLLYVLQRAMDEGRSA